MKIGIEILPNISSLVKLELEYVLGDNFKIDAFSNDFLFVETGDLTETIVRLFIFSRTVSRVYLVLDVFDLENKDDLYKHALNIDWVSLFSPNLSFAVVPESNTIDRVIIGKLVGQGIVDNFKKNTGTRPKVDLKNPDISILARIQDKTCILGIDITGFDLNDIHDIVSRLAILASNWSKEHRFAEVLHSGICESAYELYNFIPLKERIVDTTYVNLNIVDQERVIKLLTKQWQDTIFNVACYDPNPLDIEYKYPITSRDLYALEKDKVDNICSNLVAVTPSKNQQATTIVRLVNLIIKNEDWTTGTIICRTELMNTVPKIRTEKIVDINIRGIPSTILRIGRD